MKYHKGKQICWAIHYSHGIKLNWKPRTIKKMEKHRARVNKRDNFMLQKKNNDNPST